MTERQHQLLIYIVGYTNEYGYAPSYDEMCEGIGQRSKNGIHRLVYSLCDRGYVTFEPGLARSIEVLRLPENFVCSHCGEPYSNSGEQLAGNPAM